MSDFLTVTEAARHTGRSASSLRRRILYPIIENAQHPDRSHLKPSVEEVQRLRMKGENFAWQISRTLLDREAPAKSSAGNANEKSKGGGGDEPSVREVATLLREQLLLSQQQLVVKDQQIAAQLEITRSLNDRLREGNILIGSLQRQLSLTSGEPQAAAGFENTATEVTPPPPTPKSPKPAPKKPAKKGFFARVFG